LYSFRPGRPLENKDAVSEGTFLPCRERPVGKKRHSGVDETLLINSPTTRMVQVIGVVEKSDPKAPPCEGPFNGTPGGSLPIAGPAGVAPGIEVRVLGIGFIPRHPRRQSTNREFAEGDVATLGA